MLDNVATSSGTSVLLGVAALIAALVLPQSHLWDVAAWVVVAVAMLPLIRHYNITRSGSPVACALFLLLQAAGTGVSTAPLTSDALTAATVAGMALLFAAFQNRNASYQAFTAALIASGGSVYCWAFAPLAAVWLIGIVQMRALSMRTLTATLLGVVTAPLLLYGFGIAPLSLPALPMAPAASGPAEIHLYATAGFAALLSLVFGSACGLKSYGYQPAPRACNALIYTISIYAMAVTAADLGHCANYLGVLNLCAAYHVGHFAVSHSRGWVTLLTVTAAIAALYVWNL